MIYKVWNRCLDCNVKGYWKECPECGVKISTTEQIRGYGGLTYTRSKLIKYLPTNIKTYCEPFAGLGRFTELITADKIILNDMSKYAITTLQDKFPNAEITSMDFMDFIKQYDSENTLFFCDPPWRKNIYDNHNAPSFTEKSVRYYYDKLLDILPKCKGDWIITSDRAEVETGKRLSKSGFPNITLQADEPTPKFYGRLPAVRLCSNKILGFTKEVKCYGT